MTSLWVFFRGSLTAVQHVGNYPDGEMQFPESVGLCPGSEGCCQTQWGGGLKQRGCIFDVLEADSSNQGVGSAGFS